MAVYRTQETLAKTVSTVVRKEITPFHLPVSKKCVGFETKAKETVL